MVEREGRMERAAERRAAVASPWWMAMWRMEVRWGSDERRAVIWSRVGWEVSEGDLWAALRVKVWVVEARREASVWILRQVEMRERGCAVVE